MSERDLDYFTRRAEQEAAMAERAKRPEAAAVHRELCAAYRQLASTPLRLMTA